MIVEPSPLSGLDLARLRSAREVRDQSPQNGPAEAGRPVRPILRDAQQATSCWEKLCNVIVATSARTPTISTLVSVSDGNE